MKVVFMMVHKIMWLRVFTSNFILILYIEVELTEDSKGEFSYKEVSEISDLTEESFPDGVNMTNIGVKDLENYERLME